MIEKERAIEEKLRPIMNDIGKIIGQAIRDAKENMGFALFVFDFGEGGRINYISNAQREDMLATLKAFIASCEGRMQMEEEKKQ